MSKYNRKKENPAVATTDEFVGFWQKTFERVRPFARAIGWSLAGFVVVAGAGTVAANYLAHRTEGASEQFSRVTRIYELDLVGAEPTADGAKDKDQSDALLPHYKTAKERAEGTLAEVDKLPPAAAKNARLFRAGVLYDLERWEEARAAYALAAEGASVEIAVVAREGVALCLEQLGKLDDAIAAYDKVAPKDDQATEFYRDRALMGLGRLYEKKGDKPAAIERYKELTSHHSTSPLRDDAQHRLTVLAA